MDIKQQLHTDNFYLLKFTIYFKELEYTEDAVGFYDRFKNELTIYESYHNDFQNVKGDTSILKLKHIENNLYVAYLNPVKHILFIQLNLNLLVIHHKFKLFN